MGYSLNDHVGALEEARRRADANGGVGVVYVDAVPRYGRRGWAGEVAVVETEQSGEQLMLVFTEQRPSTAKVNAMALAEALERHRSLARLQELSAESEGIRMDGLVPEDEFLAIFPW
jgi:hypothetical protein